MPRLTLVLATRSAGKLRELMPLLDAHDCSGETLEAIGVVESVEEDALEAHATFEANALAKARYFAERTGRIVLADDSGLSVDALDGRPGVHSKRWSGRADLSGAALEAENNRFLQAALLEAARFGRDERTARYVCAAAAVGPGGELVVRGETTGALLTAARGDGGFGYDPYFLSDDLGRTFAQVSKAEKAAVSHRGRAFRELLARLDEFAVAR